MKTTNKNQQTEVSVVICISFGLLSEYTTLSINEIKS